MMMFFQALGVLLLSYTVLSADINTLNQKVISAQKILQRIEKSPEAIEAMNAIEKAKIVIEKQKTDTKNVFKQITNLIYTKRFSILQSFLRNYGNHVVNKRKNNLHNFVRNILNQLRISQYEKYRNDAKRYHEGSRYRLHQSRIIANKLGLIFRNIRKRTEESESFLKKFSVEFAKKDVENLKMKIMQLNEWIQAQSFNVFQKAKVNGKSGLKRVYSIQAGAESYMSSDYCGSDGVAGINDKQMMTKNQLSFGPVDLMLHGTDVHLKRKSYNLRMENIPKLPENIAAMTIEKQIIEMRKYFEAFQKEDENIAPYKNFFKIYLTLIEGNWKDGEDNNDLFQFCTETATPDSKCSEAEYNPTRTIQINKNSNKFAYFKHEIVTSQTNINLKKLTLVNDLSSQKREKLIRKDWQNSKCARYTMEYFDSSGNFNINVMTHTYMDSIVEDITGNSGNFYDRRLNNSFDDDQVYFKKSTNGDVTGPTYNGDTAKMLYAIPSEIIVVTPLQFWNPFNLAHFTSCDQMNGGGTYENPYTGTCDNIFYRTPLEFFTSVSNDIKQLCTEYKGVFMKVNGESRCCLPSGVRVILPKIDGIDDNIRTRYPIIPLSSEGQAEWKKLKSIEKLFHYRIQFETGEAMSKFGNHKHHLVFSRSELNRLDKGEVIQTTTIRRKESEHQHIVTIRKTGDKIKIVSCDSGQDNNNGRFCFDQHNPDVTELPI